MVRSRRRSLPARPPEPKPRRADSKDIVEAILAAAIELGPDAPFTAIAARAGVGTASLHRYFPTTAALFAEIWRRMFHTLLEQIRAVTAQTDLDLHTFVDRICRLALDGPNVPDAYRRRLNLDVPLAWSAGVVEQTYDEIAREVALWMRRSLPDPPRDVEARVFLAFAAVRGTNLLSLLFPTQAPPYEALLQQMVRVVTFTLIGDDGS